MRKNDVSTLGQKKFLGRAYKLFHAVTFGKTTLGIATLRIKGLVSALSIMTMCGVYYKNIAIVNDVSRVVIASGNTNIWRVTNNRQLSSQRHQ